MAERIGQGSCPVCGSPKARYTLSKKQLICVTCDACNVQVFARSDRSDQLLRQLIKPDQVSEPAPPAAPGATGSPGEPPAADPPAADPAPETPPAPPRRRSLMEW